MPSGWECYGWGRASLTTRDVLNIQLAWSESGAYVDTGANEYNSWWDGWAWWNTWAGNPSAAGTHWTFDNGSSYLDFGVSGWTDAWSLLDAYFYNDDFPAWFNSIFSFPVLSQQRTTVEHYTSTYATGGYGWETRFAAGITGYYDFLHADVSDEVVEWCQ